MGALLLALRGDAVNCRVKWAGRGIGRVGRQKGWQAGGRRLGPCLVVKQCL